MVFGIGRGRGAGWINWAAMIHTYKSKTILPPLHHTLSHHCLRFSQSSTPYPRLRLPTHHTSSLKPFQRLYIQHILIYAPIRFKHGVYISMHACNLLYEIKSTISSTHPLPPSPQSTASRSALILPSQQQLLLLLPQTTTPKGWGGDLMLQIYFVCARIRKAHCNIQYLCFRFRALVLLAVQRCLKHACM